jgi:hypothetical protein
MANFEMEEQMHKAIISMALLALLGAPAVAQSGKGTSNTSGAGMSGGIPPAPIGHRQPRASDVPDEKNLASDPLSKENAQLDKKIKSICRGC